MRIRNLKSSSHSYTDSDDNSSGDRVEVLTPLLSWLVALWDHHRASAYDKLSSIHFYSYNLLSASTGCHPHLCQQFTDHPDIYSAACVYLIKACLVDYLPAKQFIVLDAVRIHGDLHDMLLLHILRFIIVRIQHADR